MQGTLNIISDIPSNKKLLSPRVSTARVNKARSFKIDFCDMRQHFYFRSSFTAE